MREKKTFLLLALAILVLFGGSTFLYQRLVPATPVASSDDASAAAADGTANTGSTADAGGATGTGSTTDTDGTANTGSAASQTDRLTASGAKPATDFIVLNDAGNEVRLMDFLGTPVIVNFWATWCGPCRSELAYFDDYKDRYDGRIAFLMVDVTDGQQDTVDSVQEFLIANGYDFDTYYDVNASGVQAYEVMGIPKTIAMDADGNLVYERIGAMDEATLARLAQELTEE